MLNIYICEDNNVQRALIKKAIDNTLIIEELDMKLALETPDPNKVLEAVENTDMTGLYFLDIDLNANMNGIKLAQHIRDNDPRGFIVFVTSHSEMSMLTFNYKVEAMDFILKDDPDKIATRIRECMLKANERYSSLKNNIQKNFVIKVNDKKFVVDYKDILYFETSLNIHKVILYTKNRKLEFIAKMKDIEAQVDERFYRCHRSFLVNVDNIKEIDSNNKELTMNNGAKCLISVRMMKGLKALMR